MLSPQSVPGARPVLLGVETQAAMDFFDRLRTLGISEEEIRKMRDDKVIFCLIRFEL